MGKYIVMLAIGLICHDLTAALAPRDFLSGDDLIAYVKQDQFERVLYDTNGTIKGVHLPVDCCTDHNLRILSAIRSIRYLSIGGTFVSSNGIRALAEYPHLTGLGIVCGSGPKKDLAAALPCLTNLQSLQLSQTAYQTNDAIYLAQMTNLMALKIAGFTPRTRTELLPLTNLVHLRKLLIFTSEDGLKNVDGSMFSRFEKLTTFVVSSELSVAESEAVWKKPVEE